MKSKKATNVLHFLHNLWLGLGEYIVYIAEIKRVKSYWRKKSRSLGHRGLRYDFLKRKNMDRSIDLAVQHIVKGDFWVTVETSRLPCYVFYICPLIQTNKNPNANN